MFRKILIANRGEIACRIARTAHRMGIATVAVYSDADRGAWHVAAADEAFRIGPAPAAESYLCGDRIIEAAKASGAEAIHPGYGFLSENAEFAEACAVAGIVFVGPPSAAIRAMGLKDAAKRVMEQAGVPVVPGFHGDRQDDKTLAREAAAIGYPVLIKARAGGGGKGMRKVTAAAGLAEALAGARREAKASFGDDGVILEKYLTRARHIEMQVFADAHGNVVHLFERDCSLQRRHQKVIEEAPAPQMPIEMRQAMGKAAVAAATAIGYRGAGTIEFIADVTGGLSAERFYFMEMNTRLQVEHPVTEMITGLDLVEWQLRVAAGEPLPLAQHQIGLAGHAFEARIYAEDPAKGFLPATGLLTRLRLSDGEAGVRVDSGVREGDAITPFYDPMIAKLIVQGPTRELALDRLKFALGEVEIAGCTTNVPFLLALAASLGVGSGEMDTGLIERELETLTTEPPLPDAVVAVAALASAGALASPAGADPWSRHTGWRLWGPSRHRASLRLGETTLTSDVTFRGDRRYDIGLAGRTLAVELLETSDRTVRLDLAGRVVTLPIARGAHDIVVFSGGSAHRFAIRDDQADMHEGEEATNRITAPLPGTIRVVHVATGESVQKGHPLIVMEAMKMEHTLRAPFDGIAGAISVAPGDQIAEGAVLLTIDRPEG